MTSKEYTLVRPTHDWFDKRFNLNIHINTLLKIRVTTRGKFTTFYKRKRNSDKYKGFVRVETFEQFQYDF